MPTYSKIEDPEIVLPQVGPQYQELFPPVTIKSLDMRGKSEKVMQDYNMLGKNIVNNLQIWIIILFLGQKKTWKLDQ